MATQSFSPISSYMKLAGLCWPCFSYPSVQARVLGGVHTLLPLSGVLTIFRFPVTRTPGNHFLCWLPQCLNSTILQYWCPWPFPGCWRPFPVPWFCKLASCRPRTSSSIRDRKVYHKQCHWTSTELLGLPCQLCFDYGPNTSVSRHRWQSSFLDN